MQWLLVTEYKGGATSADTQTSLRAEVKFSHQMNHNDHDSGFLPSSELTLLIHFV